MPSKSSQRNSHSPCAATLADVGREAGVSAMAASAVLNSARTSSRIAPKTRDRILAAAARLSYRPNVAARALARRRMQTIGVVGVTDEGELNYYFLEVLTGILATAAHHEQNTTVFAIRNWSVDAPRINSMCDGRIDGLILVAPTLTRAASRLLPAHTPFVSLHANATLSNVVNIESDEEHGAYAVTQYLLARGHRRILHVTGPRGFIGAARRIDGFKRALAGAHIRFSENLLLPSEFSSQSGRTVMRTWLRQNAGQPLPDAVFCASDGIALGCLEVFADAGLRVPDDISVVGFDDTLAARTTMPQLTTVRQPLRAMGSRAVEVLIERLQRTDGAAATEIPKPIVFPVELALRASVASPHAPGLLVPDSSGSMRSNG